LAPQKTRVYIAARQAVDAAIAISGPSANGENSTMTSRSITRRTAVGLLGGAVAAPHVARAQTISWQAYTYGPVSNVPPTRAIARICEELEKQSGGRMQMRLHLGGSLPIQAGNISQAVADDVVQFGDDGFFQGNIPIGGVLRLPMLINTREEFETAARIMHPYLEKAYARKGMLVLGAYIFPLQVAWSSKKLTSLAEMKGRKMRVTSPEQAEFVRRSGATPVTIGPSEVPSALDRGIVDGVFTAAAGGGRIWKDLLKYVYDIGPNLFDAVFIVNKAAFEKLPPDIQALMRKLAAEATPVITDEHFKDEETIRAQLKAAGMIITPASADDIKDGVEKLRDYWQQWAKQRGPDAVEALAKVQAALGR
jgi:TRAP-type C4-dicarboxylate transport system substrate-binding protein